MTGERAIGAAMTAGAILWAACGGAAAQNYSVVAYTTVNDDLGSYVTYDYNYPIFATFNGAGSYSQVVACTSPTSCIQGGAGEPANAPTDLTYAAVSAYAQGDYPGDQFHAPHSTAVTGEAYADLANGTLGVAGSSTPSFDAGQTSPTSQAVAAFGDLLTFEVPDATPSTVTDIEVSFILYGDFINGLSANLGDATARNILYFGNATDDETVYEAPGTTTPGLDGIGANGWVSSTVGLDGSKLTFSGVYAITGADPSVGIYDELQLRCSAGFTCDYQHTGVIDITAPTGVTYTSGSGVFLTEPFSEAPEPAAWTLMLLGFGALGAALRRDRRRLFQA